MGQDGQLLAFLASEPSQSSQSSQSAREPASCHHPPSSTSTASSLVPAPDVTKQQTALVTASHRSDLGGLATPTACQSVNWRLAMLSQGPQLILAMCSRKSADLVPSAGWPWGMDSAFCCLDIDTHTYICDDSIEPFPKKHGIQCSSRRCGRFNHTLPVRKETRGASHAQCLVSQKFGKGGERRQPSPARIDAVTSQTI